MIDDIEDGLFEPQRRRMFGQQHADAEVGLATEVFRNQRVSGFLDAVVNEAVSMRSTIDEASANHLPEMLVHVVRVLEDQAKRFELRAVPEACQLFQDICRRLGKTSEFSNHQVDDVIGVAFGPDLFIVPSPDCRVWQQGE